MPDPNQNNSNNQSSGNVPIIPPVNDTPPLPPDFQSVSDATSNQQPEVSALPNTSDVNNSASTTTQANDLSGSAAPSDLPPVVTPPKKKFGGGRVIATILGLFLLVGGIGAGIILTSQQQLFEQKASGTNYCTPTDAINGYCTPQNPGDRGCLDSGCNSGYICHCQGGQGCNYGVCVPDSNFHTACEGDGREVCSNSNEPGAVTCCAAGYVCGGSGGCVPGGNPPGSNPPSNPPGSNPPPSASCQSIKAYSSTWTLLSAANLSTLSRGTSINFCVTGTTTSGSFDKGRFTINGAAAVETTTKRPNSNDYCLSYTIPATGSTFNVTADIHHVTLGWK